MKANVMYDTSEKYTFFQIRKLFSKLTWSSWNLLILKMHHPSHPLSCYYVVTYTRHIHTCQQYSTFDMPWLASGTNFISCFGSPRGFHFMMKWKPLWDPDEIFIFYILQFVQEPIVSCIYNTGHNSSRNSELNTFL